MGGCQKENWKITKSDCERRLTPGNLRRAETVSTLKFAHRAKAVRNAAHVNEDGDSRTLLRKYEAELRKLRAELQLRQREVVDKRHLLAVQCCSLLASPLPALAQLSLNLWSVARSL